MQNIIDKLLKFRNEREWQQFHNPKDLALALSIEAAELNELFLWKKPVEVEQVNQDRIAEELADVFAYSLMLLHHYDLDLETIMDAKLKKNAEKYPIEKSRNLATKYTEL